MHVILLKAKRNVIEFNVKFYQYKRPENMSHMEKCEQEIYDKVEELHDNVRAYAKAIQWQVQELTTIENKLGLRMDIEDKSRLEFWNDVHRIKRNVLDFNKKKPHKSRGTRKNKTASSMEFCGMVVAKQETSKNMQSTTEWKENMKIKNQSPHRYWDPESRNVCNIWLQRLSEIHGRTTQIAY